MTDMTLGEGIALLQRRGALVKGLLVAGIVSSAMVFIGEVAEFRGLVSLAEEAPVEGLNALYVGILMTDLVLAFVTYVIFCMWIYRAAANIKAARTPRFAFTPAWAVGWHFVPIANLFKPYRAMRQIWNASLYGDAERSSGSEGLLIGWWGAWCFSLVVGVVMTRASIDAASPAEEREALILGLVYSATNLIVYPLALCLVDRITKAQRDRLTAAQIFT
ncbi:hypothetical protein BWQ93_04145 [Sphingopyxis sp. QXT-31]|uniref:DUF4328 domain-containing protein n=1 Tax=Sphingopyxis sp. QXT-31 TaxID=1357916 RepID=UPI00097983C8|nr:DUF4328 domain-containing protein [Sphingopyxis sp. QXT-31]APZ97768.1 hypothetical protein BWQ93_04145 [Sphingopyxis sp. QXT-31]